MYYLLFSASEPAKNLREQTKFIISAPFSPHDIEPGNYENSVNKPKLVRDKEGNSVLEDPQGDYNNEQMVPIDSTVSYYDLTDFEGNANGKEKDDLVLLLIPLRNAEKIMSLMFYHLMNMTYPHDKIDLAFLVSDCSEDDNTLKKLEDYTMRLQNSTLADVITEDMKDAKVSQSNPNLKIYNHDLYLNYMDPDRLKRLQDAFKKRHEGFEVPFRSIQIYEKDFGQVIGQGFSDRHGVAVQGIRRKLMGRARNWLLTNALKPYHSWVYWRDVDIEEAPGTILEDMMKFDKDVIVPNIWRPLPDFLDPVNKQQPYDLNSWPESDTAIELAKTLPEDEVIVEGYSKYPTYRYHLANLRDPNGDINNIIDLDGIGGVSILAKAKVFRQGSHFPAFTFENHAETEAFGKMCKRMGFSVAGLPNYVVWHIYEPSEDDLMKIAIRERRKRHRKGKRSILQEVGQ